MAASTERTPEPGAYSHIPSSRERRKAKARLEITRAALKLFAENGYEATTVAEIAQAADYSVRTFYRYFTSKEEVVFSNIDHLVNDVRTAMEDVPTGTPLWDVIRRNVMASIEHFQEPGQELAAAVQTWMADPSLAGPFLRFLNRWHQVIAEGWGNANGVEDPAHDLEAQLVAHYVVSTCQVCIRLHFQTGQQLRPLLEAGFDHLEEGFGLTRQGTLAQPQTEASS